MKHCGATVSASYALPLLNINTPILDIYFGSRHVFMTHFAKVSTASYMQDIIILLEVFTCTRQSSLHWIARALIFLFSFDRRK